MPFAAPLNLNDPNDPNKQNQNGVNISGQGTSFATGVPGQEVQSQEKGQKASGSYANIQSYLDANKDQADQMGQKIASDVSAKADDATQKIQGLDSQAPKVDAYDPNATYHNLGSLTDDQKNQYRTQKATGGYSGPQSIDQVQGYGETQKAASDAYSAIQNTGNEYGQQQLLKDTYKRPQYSAGENKLDQVLLQNSQGSKQALEGVNQKYSALNDMFNTTATKVGNSVNSANQQALANRQAVSDAEKTQWDSLINPIQTRADQANKENPALIQRLQDDVTDQTLNQDTLDRLGLSEGQDVYDLNIGSYLNPNFTPAGLDNSATDLERTKYQALADLVGDPSRNQITADGKAINPYSFDSSKFNQDVAAKKKEMDDLYKKEYTSQNVNGISESPSVAIRNASPQQLEQYIQEIQNTNAWGAGPEAVASSIANAQAALDAWHARFNVNKIKKG